MICRQASAVEVGIMLDWAAAEGWNPGLDDAGAFRSADPEGFFMADVQGRPVAAISVVNHAPDMAFLGLYLCHPSHRGRGIGYALWQHALSHAGGRTVGLDGVAEQQANYSKSGFVRAGATTRYEGRLSAVPDSAIGLAQQVDLAALRTLDRQANGVDRPAFLSAWTRRTEHRATYVLQGADGPTGFATARDCRTGVKIGPIIAPDAPAALRLARAARVERQPGPTYIDLPASSSDLARLLAGAGFAPVFETARMYRGPAPVCGPGLQAFSTMELG